MKPGVTYSHSIGPEFAAVCLNKSTTFPLSMAKPAKPVIETREVKDHLVEVAKIVQGSSKTKQ
jgi:hypothetical protein